MLILYAKNKGFRLFLVMKTAIVLLEASLKRQEETTITNNRIILNTHQYHEDQRNQNQNHKLRKITQLHKKQSRLVNLIK